MSRRRRRTAPGGGGSRIAPALRWPAHRLPRSLWSKSALALVLLVAAGLSPGLLPTVHRSGRWAVIVDQLALTAPNPAFAESATQTLEAGGYGVDYVHGESVNVDYYRNLPAQDYDVVVFRAHSGRLRLKGQTQVEDDAGLFTTQVYSRPLYADEQLDERLFIARYLDIPGPSYFGIAPKFISRSMRGSFHGATIILMGCDGARGEQLAAAFKEKGAGAVIGWDELVTSNRTDAATDRLLTHLVHDGLSPEDAVRATMREIGPDWEYASRLVVFQGDRPASANN